MSKPIKEIEGIGPTNAEKFANIGIHTTKDLLNKGCTKEGRKYLTEKTGISEKLILEWVNLADLFRIEGVGEEYSDLLEEAGVDTAVELSNRNPQSLHGKLTEINEKKKLVRQLPSLDMIKKWIEQAKRLPRVVKY